MPHQRIAGVIGGAAVAILAIACTADGPRGADSGAGIAESAAASASATSSATSSEAPHTLIPFIPGEGEDGGKSESEGKSEGEVRARLELGRILFFDPRLSGDNTLSCASCHLPEKGFTDGQATAAGKAGKLLARNTPTLINLASRGPYFLDGRAASLEAQALMPVESPDEMAEDIDQLIGELSLIPEYVARFKRA